MPTTKNTPSTHHPRRRNVTTLMVGLKKKRSHMQKSHPKVVNPRDIAGERKKQTNKQKLSLQSHTLCMYTDTQDPSLWSTLQPTIHRRSGHRSTLMVCHGRYQGWRWRGLHPIWSRQVYTGGSAMDTTRDGGVYIQYGAEDRSTLMVCHGHYQGWRWRGLHPIWSRRQVYTDGSAMDATKDGGGGVYIQYGADTGLH